MNNKAVFIDKDGTLIENVPYNVDLAKIEFKAGALDGLRALHEAGYQLIIVSNQSGVAFGRFKEEDLGTVEEHLRQLLQEAGIPLTGFYYCPHHPDGVIAKYTVQCFCRKPNPGLIFRAAREHAINLGASWMIGDILNDVEAGRRADSRTILVNNGGETEWKISPLRRPHFTVTNLLEASRIILSEDAASKPAFRPATSSASNLTVRGNKSSQQPYLGSPGGR